MISWRSGKRDAFELADCTGCHGAVASDGVDLLRGLSIIAVILLHGQIRLLTPTSPDFHSGAITAPDFPCAVLAGRQWGDGFLRHFRFSHHPHLAAPVRVAGQTVRLGIFYRDRFARIAPLFLLLLVVLSVLDLVHAEGFVINPARETLPRALFAALTFQVNWYEAIHGYLPANWDVMWSLSIEEMFYLFFPLVCVLIVKRRLGMPVFAAMLLAMVAMGPFARTVWSTNGIWQGTSYVGGMSGIALGCLTALLMDWLQRKNPKWTSAKGFCWPFKLWAPR